MNNEETPYVFGCLFFSIAGRNETIHGWDPRIAEKPNHNIERVGKHIELRKHVCENSK